MALLACVLLSLLIAVGEANKANPFLFHTLHVRQGEQTFGTCSRSETESLFEDYPQFCYDAFTRLATNLKRGTADATIVGDSYSTICSAECRTPIENFREQCDAGSLTDRITSACAQNDGQFCVVDLLSNNGGDVVANCQSVIDTGRCPAACREAIEQLRDQLGCCVNTLFNTTTFGYDVQGIADFNLWRLCGVDTLTFCANTAQRSAATTAGLHPLSLILLLTTALFTLCFGL